MIPNTREVNSHIPVLEPQLAENIRPMRQEGHLGPRSGLLSRPHYTVRCDSTMCVRNISHAPSMQDRTGVQNVHAKLLPSYQS